MPKRALPLLAALLALGGAAAAACREFDSTEMPGVEAGVGGSDGGGADADGSADGGAGAEDGAFSCRRRRESFGTVSECMGAAGDGGCRLDAGVPAADAGCDARAVVCECVSSTAGVDLVTDDCACR